MAATKRKSKPRKDRGGRHCMVLELDPSDRQRLEQLMGRYKKHSAIPNPSLSWVLRQLIRNAEKSPALPPIIAE